MHRLIQIILLAFLSISTISFHSCGNNTKDNSILNSNPNRPKDSFALRVAILPIHECDVLKFAKESGLADNHNLNIEFIEYDALMDIDTALLSEMAHIYFEDSLRVSRIDIDSLKPELLLPIPVKVSLITNKDKEITKVSELKTNMVGLTRWSQLENLMIDICNTDSVEQTDIYHAQINNIPLRFSMVHEGLIDGALIPEPWADSLQQLGHYTLRDTIIDGMGLYLSHSANKDSVRKEQAQLLKKIYLEALKKISVE